MLPENNEFLTIEQNEILQRIFRKYVQMMLNIKDRTIYNLMEVGFSYHVVINDDDNLTRTTCSFTSMHRMIHEIKYWLIQTHYILIENEK